MAHSPAVYKDSPHPHWILGSPRVQEARVSARRTQASGRESGGCPALCTQPSQEAAPEGIPSLDPEIPFGSLHLVSFSLVASPSLLFLPSGVHYTISHDVTKLKSLVGFKYVEGFVLGCFTLKQIQKLPQRQEINPELTQRDLLTCQQRAASEACQQLQPMCCPFNCFLNFNLP